KYNSNVHRGLYPLAEKATSLYENARVVVANFINAKPDEIIFTSGTTEGLNTLAYGLQKAGILNKDSNILNAETEHHSNLLPFREIGCNISYLSINSNFEIDLNNINVNPDLISISLQSNVTGFIA